MATVLNGNSEAGFIFASMTEFIHLWRSGKEASIKIDCKDKQAFLNISCSLGHPDQPHIPVVKRRKKKRKSNARAARDRARAACHQETQASCPEPAAAATTPKRTATSPLESSPKRPVSSLPVWDPNNTSSPGVLRGSLQDVSRGEDIPQDVSLRTYPQDVSLGEDTHIHGAKEDDCSDSAHGQEDEDGRDETEDEDENEDDCSTEPTLLNCQERSALRDWPTLSLRRSKSEPWLRQWWNLMTPSDAVWWPVEMEEGREYSRDDMLLLSV